MKKRALNEPRALLGLLVFPPVHGRARSDYFSTPFPSTSVPKSETLKLSPMLKKKKKREKLKEELQLWCRRHWAERATMSVHGQGCHAVNLQAGLMKLGRLWGSFCTPGSK